MSATRWLAVIAVGFGIVSVYFNTRQNPLGWATGLVNVGLYTVFFYQGKLFALMGLQVFFAIVSIYGWYQWLRGGQQRTGLKVTRIEWRRAAALTALAAVATAVLGWYLDTRTEDRQPYWDAGISVVSLAGQWLMARKYLETWLIWIGVNVVSVPLFIARAEYPTALQYSVFLGLAVSGLRQWHRSVVAP
jgi:nicotinamide mononucleotide transporter